MIWSFSWNISAQQINKIAIIDTGFNITSTSKLKLCTAGHKDFTASNNAFKDNIGHGTHIGNIIGNFVNKNNYCAIVIKYINNLNDKDGMETTIKALTYLKSVDNLIAINYSSNGADYSFQEENALLRLNYNDVKIFVAAGNHSTDLDKNCNAFPTCYHIKNVVSVGNLENVWKRSPSSNYGKIVTDWEIGTNIVAETAEKIYTSMTGTSQATGIATSLFLNRTLP